MTDQHGLTNDELLSALLDGALAADEAARLRKRLADDPALAARLEQLQRVDSRLRGAYAALLEEPLPESVVERLRPSTESRPAPGLDADTRDGRQPKGSAVGLRSRDPRYWFSLPAAVAAAVALVVGVLVGNALGPDGMPQTSDLLAGAGMVEPRTTLHDVLQSVPSAVTREIGSGATATPRFTFRTQDGDYCRQIDLASAPGSAEVLACRRSGQWRVEVASFTARPAEGADIYRPAASASTPVRAAVDSMIAGAPLDADVEQALIAGGWAAQR